MSNFDLPRRLVAEALGTALLVATVVGSGIMAETPDKDVALALLGNTLADRRDPCGADHHSRPDFRRAFQSGGLAGLCAASANCRRATRCSMSRRRSPAALLGTMVAHAMFALPLLDASLKARTGGAQWFAEAVAAFGLVATILAGIRFRARGGAMAGRPLHHGGLLVHRLDLVCQSRRRDRALADQHVFRHPPARPARASSSPSFAARSSALMLMNWLLRAGREGTRSQAEAQP